MIVTPDDPRVHGRALDERYPIIALFTPDDGDTALLYNTGAGPYAWVPINLAVINDAISARAAEFTTGDTGFALPNAEASTLEPGTPVADLGGLGARRGVATSLGLAAICGLVINPTAPTLHTRVQQTGPMTLTTAQWDARTGQSGGLTAGATYYLDVSAGRISTSPPTLTGHALTVIGSALGPTTMLLAITRPIFL